MRYLGSKKLLVKYLKPIIEKNLTSKMQYVEPFVGGANLFSEINHPNKIGADLNQYVIEMWKGIQNGTFIPPKELSKDEYIDIKNDYINKSGKYPKSLIGYVGPCCSNSSAWFNGYANFNPKKNENHIKEAYNGIMKQISNFKYIDTCRFISCSYDMLDIARNSLIYCDPPYCGTKKYESDFDSSSFWDWCRRKTNEGNIVLISEYMAPDDFISIFQKEKYNLRIGTNNVKRIESLFVHESILDKIKI